MRNTQLSLENILILGAGTVIFVGSIIGNGLVLLTLWRHKGMRTVTNVYLLNISITDLLLTIFCLPFTVIGYVLQKFVFGSALCRIVPFLQATSVSANMWTLVALSLERASKVNALIWLVSGLFMSPLIYINTLVRIKPGWKDESTGRIAHYNFSNNATYVDYKPSNRSNNIFLITVDDTLSTITPNTFVKKVSKRRQRSASHEFAEEMIDIGTVYIDEKRINKTDFYHAPFLHRNPVNQKGVRNHVNSYNYTNRAGINKYRNSKPFFNATPVGGSTTRRMRSPVLACREHWRHKSHAFVFTWLINVSLFIVPLILMSIAYCKIAICLIKGIGHRRDTALLRSTPSPKSSSYHFTRTTTTNLRSSCNDTTGIAGTSNNLSNRHLRNSSSKFSKLFERFYCYKSNRNHREVPSFEMGLQEHASVKRDNTYANQSLSTRDKKLGLYCRRNYHLPNQSGSLTEDTQPWCDVCADTAESNLNTVFLTENDSFGILFPLYQHYKNQAALDFDCCEKVCMHRNNEVTSVKANTPGNLKSRFLHSLALVSRKSQRQMTHPSNWHASRSGRWPGTTKKSITSTSSGSVSAGTALQSRVKGINKRSARSPPLRKMFSVSQDKAQRASKLKSVTSCDESRYNDYRDTSHYRRERRSETAKCVKVVKMLLVIVLEFFVCWTPVYLVNTWVTHDPFSFHFGKGRFLSTHIYAIHMLSYFSCFLNPITYCFLNRRFRKCFWEAVSCYPAKRRALRKLRLVVRRSN